MGGSTDDRVTAPQPYRIDIPDEVLDDLRERLSRTRWPDEIPDAEWAYGTSLAFMRRLTEYWRDGFDWRRQEAKLNAFDQFRVPIEGIDLHFIHQPGVGPDPAPLLLLHGWPGSVWEFNELIPRLTDPARFGGDAADAFTVVAPSLPGYTLSFQPGQRRFGLTEMADLFADLMTDVLGYERFVAQGGDWGASIVGLLGYRHADKLDGIHLNMLPSDDQAGDDADYAAQLAHWRAEEAGYMSIQGTKPQTLSYGMTDSPAGLAAWITEKFRSWSDSQGDVEQWFGLDSLLTNITLYWVTGAINSSFWLYYDSRHHPSAIPDGERVEVPTGYASFPGEILRPSRAAAELSLNIQHWSELPRGGHFAALEVPELLAADISEFFAALRRA